MFIPEASRFLSSEGCVALLRRVHAHIRGHSFGEEALRERYFKLAGVKKYE